MNIFAPMIPESIFNIWKKGLDSNAYYLKLCGSGGGGYILGFTKDYEKAEKCSTVFIKKLFTDSKFIGNEFWKKKLSRKRILFPNHCFTDFHNFLVFF